MATPRSMVWTPFHALLISIIVIQWGLCTILLIRHPAALQSLFLGDDGVMEEEHNVKLQHSAIDRRDMKDEEDTAIEGVAVTVMFRAPKWFHLRYKVMLDNALMNLPNENWKLQVFVNDDWLKSSQLMSWHPGLERLLYEDPRVLVSHLPNNLTQGKPKDVVESLWFWHTVAAERVILFSGNGAFCGNHNVGAWDHLLELDYCGVPSHDNGGIGGDGSSHSIRRRSAMMRLYSLDTSPIPRKGTESQYIVKLMRYFNQHDENGATPFRIATVNDTIAFGGVHNLSSDQGLERLPLVVAGTQTRLSYAERDSLLKHCPELKVIFPSLHEPTCFGAHPQPETCRKSICALQEVVPSHGC